MKRAIITYFLAAAAAILSLPLFGQQHHPLYIVNGKPSEEIHTIPPQDIEHVEELPADEQTIARYGTKAAYGVLLITLRYDEPAQFPADSLFSNYIARQVKWDDTEPAARVILRYKIQPDGQLTIDKELESTDSRLKRRVLKAVAEAPKWRPAQKKGKPVESEGVLHIQLPAGKQIQRLPVIVLR